MCETQNMTVGVSFGEARQAAFEWAGAREKRCDHFPDHLRSPAVHHGSHNNVVLSLTVPDSSTYTFGRDVNLLWKHGILAEKPPTGKMGGQIDIEEGRISIIAWGWVDQYDELDEYLEEAAGAAARWQGGAPRRAANTAGAAAVAAGDATTGRAAAGWTAAVAVASTRVSSTGAIGATVRARARVRRGATARRGVTATTAGATRTGAATSHGTRSATAGTAAVSAGGVTAIGAMIGVMIGALIGAMIGATSVTCSRAASTRRIPTRWRGARRAPPSSARSRSRDRPDRRGGAKVRETRAPRSACGAIGRAGMRYRRCIRYGFAPREGGHQDELDSMRPTGLKRLRAQGREVSDVPWRVGGLT